MNKTAVWIAGAVLISACSSVYRGYAGRAKPEAAIGVIEVGWVLTNHANIELVDEKWRGNGLKWRYEFLPGQHKLTVGLLKSPYYGRSIDTYFVAEAGKKYSIEAVMDIQKARGIFGINMFAGGTWYVIVRDKATGAVVNYVSPRK